MDSFQQTKKKHNLIDVAYMRDENKKKEKKSHLMRKNKNISGRNK